MTKLEDCYDRPLTVEMKETGDWFYDESRVRRFIEFARNHASPDWHGLWITLRVHRLDGSELGFAISRPIKACEAFEAALKLWRAQLVLKVE